MVNRRVIVLLAAALFGLSACADGREQEADGAARAFLSAVAEHRDAEACALLAPRVLEDEDCSAVLAKIQPATVGQTQVWGDGAIVRAGSDTLFLNEFSAGWLISGAACTSRGELPYMCEVGGP